MFELRSSLEGLLPATGLDGADSQRRVGLGEAALGSLVQLGIHRGGRAAVTAAAPALLGGVLPESTTAAARIGEHLAFRIAADQYLLRTPDANLASRLRAGLSAEAASVTSLDGARTGIVIGGPAARSLLGRLVAIDVDPSVFEVGRFAQVPIHHVGGLLHRAAAARYEFIAIRTFAASTWEVIEDAARFYGYDIICGGST